MKFLGPVLIGFFACVIFLAACVYAILASGEIDPSANQPIPDWERWMAKTSIRAYLKRNTPQTTNPLVVDAKVLADGADIYVQNCAVCHGYADGKETVIGKGLNKRPNIFAGEDWSQDADGLVYWFIDRGVRLTGMPSFRNSLSEEEIWKLVSFIKNLKKLPPEVQSRWQPPVSQAGARAIQYSEKQRTN